MKNAFFAASLPNAIEYSAWQRGVAPAVYNARKLLEKPLGNRPSAKPTLDCTLTSQLLKLNSAQVLSNI